MPAAIAIPIAVAAISGGASVAAGAISSKAAKNAAKTSAAAATSAAQIQSESTDKQLAYEREQSQIAQANAEVNRKANYDQWRSGRQRAGSLASMLGMPQESIPDYVPGVYSTGSIGGGGVPGAPAAPPSGTGTPPPVDGSPASISAFFKSQGVDDHETSYWVSKWPELQARGQELGDPTYAMKRLADADVFRGGRPASQAASPAYARQTLGGMQSGPGIAPAQASASPIYQRQDPYKTGSIGGLAYTG